jgi:hypothetical protein
LLRPSVCSKLAMNASFHDLERSIEANVKEGRHFFSSPKSESSSDAKMLFEMTCFINGRTFCSKDGCSKTGTWRTGLPTYIT